MKKIVIITVTTVAVLVLGIEIFDSVSSKVVKPKQGEDVPISIDIELQAVADSLLRASIAEYESVRGACMVVVNTNSGAVRTMAEWPGLYVS